MIPPTFVADHHLPTRILAAKYNRHRGTILRWKRKVVERQMQEGERVAFNGLPLPLPLPLPTPQILTIKPEVYRPRAYQGDKQPQTQVLLLSDAHAGSETPTYNPDVFKARLHTLYDDLTRIRSLQARQHPLEELVIFSLGDNINGENVGIQMALDELGMTVYDQVYKLWVPAMTEFLANLLGQYRTIRWYGVKGNHGCFDSDTELLTSHGWLPYQHLKEGMTVATFSMETHHTEWQPIERVYVYPYAGQMCVIDTRQMSVLVSPEHRMVHTYNYYYKGKRTRRLNIDQAWQICNRAGQILPVAAFSGQPEYPISDNWIRLAGWMLTDGGYHRAGKAKTSLTGAIYQSKPAHVSKIRDLLTELGIAFGESTRLRNVSEIAGKPTRANYPDTTFRIKAESLDAVLDVVPDSKVLPQWVWEISDRQVAVLLETLLDGNGSRWKGCQVLYDDKGMLDQVQALLVTHGVRSALCEYRPGDWRLDITFRQTATYDPSEGQTGYVDYNGVIWCVTTPNGTVFTRRNGKVLISGNSQRDRRLTSRNNNWDTIAQQSLAMAMEKYSQVEFDIETTEWYKLVEVRGWRYMIMHGDVVRTHTQPFSGLERRTADWDILFHPNVFCLGHFHQPGVIRPRITPIIMNGTFKSDDAWAIGAIGKSGPPVQVTFGVHPERPMSWVYFLDLA